METGILYLHLVFFLFIRFRAKWEQQWVEGLLPDSQGQNQALDVLYAPDPLDSDLLFFK